jgi:hypothetical protein
MNTRLDALAKQLGEDAPRRRVLQGLGALGLGALGIVGMSGTTEASRRSRCINRCKDHCGPTTSKRKCRQKCQRKCDQD